MSLDTLHDVIVREVRDLYSAEQQLVSALPRLAEAAASHELRSAIEAHAEETRLHVERLEQAAELCDIPLRGHTCKGMQGLLAEGEDLLTRDASVVRDAALIAAAQRIEHYEIAAYESVVEFANLLDYSEAEELLQLTLDEEEMASSKLTDIAEQVVNPAAVGADGPADGAAIIIVTR